MLALTKAFYIIFGLITLAGGIQGFLAKGSKASLIAGAVFGILLLLAGFLLPDREKAGLILGLVLTLGLAGRFLPVFFKTQSWWPAGVEGWLGAVGLILTLVTFFKK